jgi:hypothetical protein
MDLFPEDTTRSRPIFPSLFSPKNHPLAPVVPFINALIVKKLLQ